MALTRNGFQIVAYGKNDGSSDHAKRLRKLAGQHLKALREKADLTQNELARQLGIAYYTMISQIETGQVRLPPERYEGYAQALGVPVATLAKVMLKYYDPHTHKAIFGVDKKST